LAVTDLTVYVGDSSLMSGQGGKQPLAVATTSFLGGFGPLVEAMPDGIVIC